MINNWNLTGLILEGVSGTGKSTLLKEILLSEQYLKRSGFSSVVLSEHQTQRVLETKDREIGLTLNDNLSLLNLHVKYLESLENNLNQMKWCKNNQTNMRIPYILERFHFTHTYHYKHVEWKDMEDIDNRLNSINCKVVILTADSETFHKRLFTGRDSTWMNYLKRFGDHEEKIVEHYLNQQETLLEMAKRSRLPHIIIDTSNIEQTVVLEKIINFWL